MSILERINSPDDVKRLDYEELTELCRELREFIVNSVSKTGGHLASNLGAVELTLAIHRIFDTSRDRLVFDVGHQCYVHKIVTGRRDSFDTLRQYGGIAGFPKPKESVHDAFIAGHASNSISVALGMARARRLTGDDYDVIALIGDGALTGGLAYEGLTNAGASGEPMIIILNDNGMSIAPNVGGMASYLARARLKPSYTSLKQRYRKVTSVIPGGKLVYRFTRYLKNRLKSSILNCSMFEEMGFQYAGPVDGHNIQRIEEALLWAKSTGEPTLVHVITKKGKGYPPAEENPGKFHGVSSFDPVTGKIPPSKLSFSEVFGMSLCSLAEKDSRICAITAAMTDGTGLSEFAERFPERLFDVSIEEGHAVAMSAGLAAKGAIPVVAIYSTFLQRAYDMLIHDVAIGNEHVVFAVDRAGLVGQDGETHNGTFDISYLSSVPNMTVLSPASFSELGDMLHHAIYELDGPVCVRFPRGSEGDYRESTPDSVKALTVGTDAAIITYGISINDALTAAEQLRADGISVSVIKLGTIFPLDIREILKQLGDIRSIVICEETSALGCVGTRIISELALSGITVKAELLNLGDGFVQHGDTKALKAEYGIDSSAIIKACKKVVSHGQNKA